MLCCVENKDDASPPKYERGRAQLMGMVAVEAEMQSQSRLSALMCCLVCVCCLCFHGRLFMMMVHDDAGGDIVLREAVSNFTAAHAKLQQYVKPVPLFSLIDSAPVMGNAGGGGPAC